MTKDGSAGTAHKKPLSILRVVEQLDERIALGVIVPGQRLIEADLSAELGASRGAVREALRFLAGDGVVELLPYRGAKVQSLSPDRIADMLEVFGSLFRTGMELLVARPISAAAQSAIMAPIDSLRNAETQNPAQILGAMISYHETIIRHANNQYLIDLIGKLHLKYYSAQLSTLRDHEYWVDSCAYYFASAERLLKGDAVGAYDILSRSLESMAKSLRRKATRQPDGAKEL